MALTQKSGGGLEVLSERTKKAEFSRIARKGTTSIESGAKKILHLERSGREEKNSKSPPTGGKKEKQRVTGKLKRRAGV